MNKKSLLRWGLTALTIIIIASATTYAYWCHIAYASYDGDSAAWIYVPKNASSDYIRKELTDKAGDAGKNAARLWSWFNGDPSKAHGAYKIEQGTTSLQMFKSISRGSQTPVRLTFNNIRTIDQLASRVASRMEFDSLQFISSMDSILPAKGFKKSTYTAAFYPTHTNSIGQPRLPKSSTPCSSTAMTSGTRNVEQKPRSLDSRP